jgi:hypothetical protein
MLGWLAAVNQRVHARLTARPVDGVAKERAAVVALPVVEHRSETHLGRNYYLRMTSINYSVSPASISPMITISADLAGVSMKQWCRYPPSAVCRLP